MFQVQIHLHWWSNKNAKQTEKINGTLTVNKAPRSSDSWQFAAVEREKFLEDCILD